MDDNRIAKSTTLSWASYFCSNETEPIDLAPVVAEENDALAPSGLIYCSLCKQHFDNIQFMQHAIFHLFLTELHLGTLMAFEFCPECLFSPTELTMQFHTKLHQHLEKHDPYALLDGTMACPICETTFDTLVKFAVHLFERHVCCDSPYVCTICYGFHSSWYTDLMKHLANVHRFTNHVLCPYCLKHFELPRLEKPDRIDRTIVFDSHQFYAHMSQHWDQTTHRCESCRLDFIHRKDLKLHEYLHHSGHLIVKPTYEPVTQPVDPSIDLLPPTGQLHLTYSNQLQTQTPRLSIRCMECGDCLRHSINRHFNLTLKCASCAFTSSCNMSVNWHWSHVHHAPPIPPPSSVSQTMAPCPADSFWKSGLNCLGLGLVKLESKPCGPYGSRLHDPCGALLTRMKRCKHKHSPPGLYFKGVLKCDCGFQTIVCDQMARHLAVSGSQHMVARLHHGPRLTMFSVRKSSSKKSLKSSLWWLRKSRHTPAPLKAVGLC